MDCDCENFIPFAFDRLMSEEIAHPAFLFFLHSAIGCERDQS